MIEVRRLKAVGVVLGLAAVVTCTHVWGEPGRDKPKDAVRPADANLSSGKADQDFETDLAMSRFSDKDLITYQAAKGDPLQFALLLRPKVEGAARPLDVLALISDSAGTAQGPLAAAQKAAQALAAGLGAGDRMAVWTINTKTADLSNGFKTGDQLQDAFKQLAKDYPSGAVDLKTGLPEAVKAFKADPDRQRVLLYFGDGKSLANPLDDNDRAALCTQMVQNEIGFFAVPMGPTGMTMDAANLHGLVAGTGGAVVRPLASDLANDLVGRMKSAFAQPILYPTAFQPPPGATDLMPARLPPLRADSPTLVVGKLPAGAAQFDYSVAGKAGGQDRRVQASLAVPAPEVENYFLVDVAGQWQGAKERAAILPADRALASAAMRHELARQDLLDKAYWALGEDQLDPAFKLFDQARKLDPHCEEAVAGLDIVARIRDGKLTKEELFQQLKRHKKGAAQPQTRLDRNAGDVRVAMADPVLPPNAPRVDAPQGPLAPDAGPDILANAAARQRVADQQATDLVTDAVRRANERVLVRPADAIQDLKQTLEDIRNNPDLSERARVDLVDRLQRASQTIDRTGRRVQADQEAAQAAAANAAARAGILVTTELVQKQTRERMRQYGDLMRLGREEAAYRQAQSIRDTLIDQGQPVPVAVTAGIRQSIVGYNLRELRRLRALRDERWLATLLTVEESAVPFPDEPPIAFPDSAYIKTVTKLRYGASGSQFDNWKDFSEYRINVKRYASGNFGAPEEIGRALEFQKKLNERIDYELLIPSTLDKVLDELLARAGIPWQVNSDAFLQASQAKDVVEKTSVEKIDKLTQVTRATVLKRLLALVPSDGGKGTPTYLIRPDSVEITTTDAAVKDKIVRVYPVADLVTPIGGQVPQGGIFGFVGQANQLGGSALGQLGNFGALQLGGQGGQVGGLLNGVGGFQGFGGGQLGQLAALQGQLGGQLGSIGGPSQLNSLLQVQQSTQLISLIKQVVGKPKEWRAPIDPNTGKPTDPLSDGDQDPGTDLNDIGYYAPAQALVVKAQGRIHSHASDPLAYGAASMAMLDDKAHHVDVANAGNQRPNDPKAPKLESKEIWQDALAKGVEDPGMIIACADFLAQAGKWEHAAEFLKADLRQGIVVRPWVYKSLAIALRQSQGDPNEIERAELSTAEMEPMDAQGFLDASRAMAGDQRWDRALAFCKEAAALEPGTPYAYNEALLYAESAQDVQGMEWAAGSLLRQDWPLDNKQLQGNARDHAGALAHKLQDAGRAADGQKLLSAVTGERQRDLVVRLTWQGEADLDLKVKEPTGSVCWVLNRLTVGGGSLTGDAQSDPNSESYQASEAFSGDYEVMVDRVWGRPLSDKAQLTITRHQGTPQETQELLTVDVKSGAPVKLKLADGRRKEVAYVPPPSAVRSVKETVVPTSGRIGLLNKLRQLSEPEPGTAVTVGLHGSSAARAEPTSYSAPAASAGADRVVSEGKLSSFIANSLQVTSQTVLSADRQSLRVSVTPLFNTVTDAKPVVDSPAIPGAPQP